VCICVSQEVPYACSVVCTGYVERTPPQKDLVEVEIMVTRDAHKGILIGRGGDAMKALTSAARVEVGVYAYDEGRSLLGRGWVWFWSG